MAHVHVFRRKGSTAWMAGLKLDGQPKRQVPLKLYGGEADRARAEAAAHDVLTAAVAAQAREKETAHARQLLIASGIAPEALQPLAVSNQTVEDWWNEYDLTYGPYKKRGGKKSVQSLRIEAYVKERWLPLIGHLRLASLQEIDLVKAQNIRRTTRSERKDKALEEGSVAREVASVNTLLNKAVALGRLPKNPFAHAPKLATRTNAHRILTDEGEATLMALPDSVMPVYIRRFIRFLLLTGLRIDEVLNAQFQDCGTYIRVFGKGSKEREVGLVREARELLAAQYADQGTVQYPRNTHRRPWWHTPNAYRRQLAHLAQLVGIPHFSPHDLRHTFGHRWLMAGRDIKLLSLILGHSSVAVTEQHYAYLSLANVRDRMLAVMEPEAPRTPPAAPQTPILPPAEEQTPQPVLVH